MDFYFDESGSHAGTPAFVVAGYLATSAQWLAFEERWIAALHDFGVDCFHMHELEHRSVKFKGWTTETAISLQSRLIEIINQTVMIGICCGLTVADYEAATPPQCHRNIRFAYLMCFYECLTGARLYMEERKPSEPVRFIFDQNKEFSPMMHQVYNAARREWDYPDWMGPLSFEDRRRFVPLQAADLLAYEMFKHMTHRSVEPWRKNRKSLMALDTGWYSLKQLRRDDISRYTEGFFSERELD
jgi:hypothetical protein